MSAIITLPFAPSNPSPRLRLVKDWAALLPALAQVHSWHSFRSEFASIVGGGIAELADRSGKGRPLTQPAASIRPTLQQNAINGHAAGRFVNHGLQFTGAFPTSAYTKGLVVFVPSNTGTTQPTLLGHTTTVDINHRIYLEPANGRARHQVQNGGSAKANPQSSGLTLGEWHVILATFDGASRTVKIKVDDLPAVSETSANLNSIQDLPFFLGYGNQPGGVPSSPFDGLVADMITLNVDVTKAGNEALYQTLREYWREVYGIAA